MDASAWNERYEASDLVWSAGPNQFLVEEIADLRPGVGLDIACGEGRNSLWLAERGWTMTGVDFSSVAVDKARKIAERRGVSIDFDVRDMSRWSPPPASFDLVIVFYLQMSATDRPSLWERVARAVKSGGTLLIVGHDSRNISDGHGGPSDPRVLYSAAEIVNRLGGFEIVRAGEVMRTVEGSTGVTDTAIDCIVRGRRTAPESPRPPRGSADRFAD